MLKIKNGNKNLKFILTTELSSIYTQGGKVRKVHTIIFVPDIRTVETINDKLTGIGNLYSDGRPILGMDVADMSKLIWSISPDFIIIPAHAWTPWFAIFGSKSGFNSIEECFGDLTPNILAIETGLSSDPPMNWRLSQLDNISLVSNSDAHSLPNLGREATVFELEKPTIQNIRKALDKKIRHSERGVLAESRNPSVYSRDPSATRVRSARDDELNKIAYTIEFYPQEGKYHYDGHLSCKVSMSPSETKKHKGICPKCKKEMTLGVDYRVSELADRVEPKKNGDYKYIVPLQEIIADALDQGKQSKRVQETYEAMIKELGNEFSILLDIPIEKIKSFGIAELAEGVRRVRAGELYIEPGYDGQYGIVKVFKPSEQVTARARQSALF